MRCVRCREELVGYVGELQSLLAANATMQRDRAGQDEQVAAAEQAIKVIKERGS